MILSRMSSRWLPLLGVMLLCAATVGAGGVTCERCTLAPSTILMQLPEQYGEPDLEELFFALISRHDTEQHHELAAAQ